MTSQAQQMIPARHHHLGMLIPDHWKGPANLIPEDWPFLHWIRDLPGKTWCYFWATTPSVSRCELPPGYDRYLVSFHLEAIDWEWIHNQAACTDGLIVVMADGNYYDYPVPHNVKCLSWIHWHRQIDLIMQWFPNRRPREILYKASAMCNRISQSKLITTTALLEYLDRKDIMIKINTWLELKNVHFWQPSGMPELDYLTEVFRNKYNGKVISFDNFVSGQDNYQRRTADPWQDVFRCVALNFTNESYHYSFMDLGDRSFITPGPFLTEKTLRCLPGGTPFIAVGQFDTYGSLQRLGLKFDYDFDMSWDQDSGNLTRLQSIVVLIHELKNLSAMEIYDRVRESTEHNQDMIWSNEFFRRCEAHNARSIQLCFDLARS